MPSVAFTGSTPFACLTFRVPFGSLGFMKTIRPDVGPMLSPDWALALAVPKKN
jgi:hypothetical protein